METFKKGLPLFFTGIFFLVVLDSIGSIASRELNFKYSYLLPFSFAVYILIPFFTTKKADRKTAIIFAALLGLFDATAGWKISITLKANTGQLHPEVSTVVWATVAIIMTISATLLGILSAWVASKLSK